MNRGYICAVLLIMGCLAFGLIIACDSNDSCDTVALDNCIQNTCMYGEKVIQECEYNCNVDNSCDPGCEYQCYKVEGCWTLPYEQDQQLCKDNCDAECANAV
jgi:hypothetical protein